MAAHIFISYSTRNSNYAYRLAEQLQAEGFDVWIDNAQLRSGSNWWESIVLALRDCAAVIVIMTPDSRQSKWVQREVTLADNWNKPTFPLLLAGRNWEIFVLTQFRDVSDGSLPPQNFYKDLAIHAQRRSEGGTNVTSAAALPDDDDDPTAIEEIQNPPPPEDEPAAAAQPASIPVNTPDIGQANKPLRARWLVAGAGIFLAALAALFILPDSLNVTITVTPTLTTTPEAPTPTVGPTTEIPTVTTPTIASTATSAAVSELFPNTIMHTVKSGDTLSTIAFLYGSTASAIAEANGFQTNHPIQLGQVLTIPVRQESPPTPAATSTQDSVYYPAPLENYSVSRSYAPDQNYWAWALAANLGEPIYAGPQGGVVLEVGYCQKCGEEGANTLEQGFALSDPRILSDAGWNFGYGHYVRIIFAYNQLPGITQLTLKTNDLEGADVACMYSHLYTIDVEQGATLSPAQQIGTVGQSGSATAPFLRLECQAAVDIGKMSLAEARSHVFDPAILFDL